MATNSTGSDPGTTGKADKYKRSLPYGLSGTGYPVWYCAVSTEGVSQTYVHQLVLVAEGEDPQEVYSEEYETHHKNGVKFDNRPSNLELLTLGEHRETHAERGDYDTCTYTDEELLDWIRAFVFEFKVVPSAEDIKHWPGPSHGTYRFRFGSLSEAVREAGFTSRRERQREKP